MINYDDIKKLLESIIQHKSPKQQDKLSIDALRAFIQLRNIADIEIGAGNAPGNYLNEIVEGGEGFGGSEINIILNNDLCFWSNDGQPMLYVENKDRMLRPRAIGGDNGDGGYTGTGTRAFMAKHGLPMYFLSLEDGVYFLRVITYENLPIKFEGENVSKKVTSWTLEEYEVSEEEYLMLCGYEHDGKIWASEYFHEVPTFFVMIRNWLDIENIFPFNSYNINRIMQRVGEQQMEHHDIKVNFFFRGEKYTKNTIYHPTIVKKVNSRGDEYDQYGTRNIDDLPLIASDVDVYEDGSSFEIRGYTAMAAKTDPVDWPMFLQVNNINQYNVVRGGTDRPRHGRVIYFDKRGTCHAIHDIGPSYLGVFLVVKRTKGKASYEKGIKSSGVPVAIVNKAKEVFDEYKRIQGSKAVVKLRPKKAEDTATDKIGNSLISNNPTEEAKKIAVNISLYTNNDLSVADVLNNQFINFGPKNKYNNRQIDMMWEKPNYDKPVAIVEYAFEAYMEHIDRTIAWGSGKRMAKHIILVLPSFRESHYKKAFKDHYIPQKGCNLIVTTYSALQSTIDTNPFKM
tara:strand:+ start:121 stop:1824 length:1704 start_codon:yes stop_codon:yes gene_type:complete